MPLRKIYTLHEKYITAANQNCKSNNMNFEITHDIDYGYTNADIVYAKAGAHYPFMAIQKKKKL